MFDIRSYRMIGFFFNDSSKAVNPSTCRSRLPVSDEVSHVEGVSPYKRDRLQVKAVLAMLSYTIEHHPSP